MSDPVKLPVLLKERQVADYLGVSVATVQRMRKRGEIRAKLVGGRWRYRVEWIEEFLERGAERWQGETQDDQGKSASIGLRRGREAKSTTQPGTTRAPGRRDEFRSALKTLSGQS